MFKGGLKSCIFKKLNFSWTSPYIRVLYHVIINRPWTGRLLGEWSWQTAQKRQNLYTCSLGLVNQFQDGCPVQAHLVLILLSDQISHETAVADTLLAYGWRAGNLNWPIRIRQAGKNVVSSRQCKLTGKALKSFEIRHLLSSFHCKMLLCWSAKW